MRPIDTGVTQSCRTIRPSPGSTARPVVDICLPLRGEPARGKLTKNISPDLDLKIFGDEAQVLKWRW